MEYRIPTEEQQDIIGCLDNLVVTAKPGSGKTYTIVTKMASILPQLPDYQGIIAISFTNKASEELKIRCQKSGIPQKASFFGTIDRFYISQIIIPFAGHLTGVAPEYSVERIVKENEDFQELSEISGSIDNKHEKLILKTLANGIIFLDIIGETAAFILERVSGVLKYLKARYKYIIIDEYQDCGQLQHEIFLKLISHGIKGIAVGDKDQAIFGFTNRFPKYLISLTCNKTFKHFELNKNHRCHPSISEYSLCLLGIQGEIPEEKRVFKVTVQGDERNIASQIDERLHTIKTKYNIDHNKQIAILCRSNSTIEKISDYLKTPHKKFLDTDLDKNNSDWGRLFNEILYAIFDPDVYAIDYIERYFSQEYDGNIYRMALNICQNIFHQQNVDTISIDMIEKFANLIYPNKQNQTAIDLLEKTLKNKELLSAYMPAANNEINIMTIHKSKGLEFNIVFHMDLYRYILPHENNNPDDKIQALNLHYVGVSRAIDACYLINGTQRYRKKENDYIDALASPFFDIQGLSDRREDITWKN